MRFFTYSVLAAIASGLAPQMRRQVNADGTAHSVLIQSHAAQKADPPATEPGTEDAKPAEDAGKTDAKPEDATADKTPEKEDGEKGADGADAEKKTDGEEAEAPAANATAAANATTNATEAATEKKPKKSNKMVFAALGLVVVAGAAFAYKKKQASEPPMAGQGEFQPDFGEPQAEQQQY